MGPWRLDPLVEERLERNRTQLAEPDGPHEGSADMRVSGAHAQRHCLGALETQLKKRGSCLCAIPCRTTWSMLMR